MIISDDYELYHCNINTNQALCFLAPMFSGPQFSRIKYPTLHVNFLTGYKISKLFFPGICQHILIGNISSFTIRKRA